MKTKMQKNKIVTALVISAFLILPFTIPSQVSAWHIGGSWDNLFIEGGAPWNGGDASPAPAPAPAPVVVAAAPVTYPAISASCSANTNSTTVGSTVSWTVNPSGGNGSYTYVWSGTDSLSGSAQTMNRTYNTAGVKTAGVVVSSVGSSLNVYCSNNVNIIDNNNYNYNNNNNNNYYNTLTVTCSANSTNVSTGNSVTWTANVSGGNGYYTYNWNGSENLYGNSRYATVNYSSSGNKTASVTVVSDGQTVTRACDNNVYVNTNYNYNNYNNYNGNYNYDGLNYYVGGGTNYPYNYNSGYNYNYQQPLTVACTADLTDSLSGNSVTWNANATGGNGYYTYTWSGTDSLVGSSASVSKTYWFAGLKSAVVSVTSNGQTISRNCANTVNISLRPVTVTQTDTPPTVTYVKPAVKEVAVLDVNCLPNSANVALGQNVIWLAQTTGGTGSYAYSWNGTDGLEGRDNFLVKTYVSNGLKAAAVTVKSGTQQVTKTCNIVAVGETETNLNLSASASSFGLGWLTLIIVLVLIILTLIIILVVTRNQRENYNSNTNGNNQKTN